MQELTRHQKDFILNNFFKNEKYPGWKGIAETLLEKGECIVAGPDGIWIGGIGNFIKYTTDKNLFNCLKYEFCIQDFLNSGWFLQVRSSYMSDLSDKIKKQQEEYNEIYNLAIPISAM